MDLELDRFKREIPLPQYAASIGYELDRRGSSKSSLMLRHPQSTDKVVVTHGADGHWTYFSVRDDRDNGTIVDVVQRRTGKTLGQIRQELRLWLGDRGREKLTASLPAFCVAEIRPCLKDRASVAEAFFSSSETLTSTYLNRRGIRPEILQDTRFRDRWRVDARGAVLFPHYDAQGLAGFEIKNRGFTGFATGGLKAVWSSQERPTDTRLVFTESAIDALSYHQLYPTSHTRYVSTGGTLSPHQRDVIRQVVARVPVGAELVGAFDADAGGDKLMSELTALATPDHKLYRHRPKPHVGKDWNDLLRARERAYIAMVARDLERTR